MTDLRPDVGRLQAYLDGELAADQVTALEERLGQEPALAAQLSRLRSSADAVRRALEGLDAPVPWPSAQERPWQTRPRSTTGSRQPRSPRHWRRAAIVVLALGAGAASALPGSPVRQWLRAGAGANDFVPVPVGTPDSAPDSPEVRTGVSVRSEFGRLTVSVAPMAPESELLVTLSEDESAWVWAGEGAGYVTAPGRVDVAAPSSLVEISLPRGLPEAVIEVGGVIYLRKIGTDLDVRGPVSSNTEGRVRFRMDAIAPGGAPGPGSR